jgi:hypothetical protein
MFDKIGLTIGGAFLGLIISFLIKSFNAASFSNWMILFALVLAMLLSLLMVGPIHLIFRSSGNIKLNNERWHGGWQYLKNGKDVIITEEITFKQYGSFLRGEAKSSKIIGDHPNNSTHYKISARIDRDGTINGHWWNCDRRRRYHGYFQGFFSRDGNTIGGQWVGLDNTRINTGSFKWER